MLGNMGDWAYSMGNIPRFRGEEIVEMSVDWGVVPAQPEEQGFREWLTTAGLEIPRLPGRFPTLGELISVLQSFEGLPIQQEMYGESSYTSDVKSTNGLKRLNVDPKIKAEQVS